MNGPVTLGEKFFFTADPFRSFERGQKNTEKLYSFL